MVATSLENLKMSGKLIIDSELSITESYLLLIFKYIF